MVDGALLSNLSRPERFVAVDRVIRRVAALGVVVAASLLVVLAGALAQWPALTAVGSLGTYLGLDRLLKSMQSTLPQRAGALIATVTGGIAVEQSLLLVLVLRSGSTSGPAEAVAVVGVVTLSVLRSSWTALQLVDAELRRERLLVRNLELPDAAVVQASRLLSWKGLPPISGPGLLLSCSAAAAVALSSPTVLNVSTALVVLLTLALAAAPLPGLVALARAPRDAAHLKLVHAALHGHAPEVVLYFGGGPGSVYAANMWLETLERIRQPAFVFVRDPAAMHRLAPTSLPVVCGPGREDVATFSQPPLRISLFAVNETENLRLLRFPRLRSAFIGHGDSDKSGSVSPLSRAYDEVWVAGPAGRQRYREADVGVRDDAIREVGRPQIARVRPPSPKQPGALYTVLYAPTWEGFDAGNHESSLEVAGQRIVAELLAFPGVRLVYRPHPRTGSRIVAVARTHLAIAERVRDEGEPHEVLEGDGIDLIACFNAADALVTDVSSVIPDFLASGKPYFVVDVRALPEDQFRREVPTASAAYIVRPGAEGLRAGLADARGVDSLRERRKALRDDLLGRPTAEPFKVFSEAVDQLAALRARPSQADTDVHG